MANAVLPVAGLCLEALGLVLHIIGLSTHKWFSAGPYSAGLWKICTVTCFDWPSKSSALEAAEAFAILGMLLGSVAVIAACLFVLMHILGREVNVPFIVMSTGAAIAAFVYIIICVICWRTEVKEARLWDLGYSFGLSVAGGILLLQGGVIIFIGGRQHAAGGRETINLS